MSRQPVAVRTPAIARQSTPPVPRQKLPLAGFIRRQLVTVAERDQARGRLLNVLILALALLTAATIPGYVGTPTAAFSLTLIGASLAIDVVAMITNGLLRRTASAAYILVLGGGVVLAAHPVLLAVSGDAMQAVHASLLLPADILIAGLLFVPEVTLLAAFGATACTAFAQLYALTVDHHVARHDAYLAVVYTLGLQLMAGLAAWLLSQFIYESAVEIQRAQQMQFAQARLEALTAKIDEDEARLQQTLSVIQVSITRAMTGDYAAHADIGDGPLAPLADNLNLLLQRYGALTQAERRQTRLDAAAMPLIDSFSRMAESGTPTSLPLITNTSLDSVSVVLTQMHATLSQRIGRIQKLVGDVADVAAHSKEPLDTTTKEIQEAQRITGKLVSDAESVLKIAQRQLASIQTVRKLLAAVLPPEIISAAGTEDVHRDASGLSPSEAAGLLGLGDDLGVNSPGYTGIFDTLEVQNGEVAAHDLVPLTVPLPAITLDMDAATEALDEKYNEKKRGKKAGDVPPELSEIWNLATQIEREIVQFERSLRGIGRDLGHQTGSLRAVDANIAWFGSALGTIATDADLLQQLAGAGLPAFGASADTSVPLSQGGKLATGGATPEPGSVASTRQQPGTDLTPPLPVEGAGDHTLVDLARGQALPNAPASATDAAQTPPANGEDSPAPGSLRASDLISMDDIQAIFGPLDQPGAE